jgi:hypothetical protein
MLLSELEPSWWTATEGRTGMGLAFLCPHCKTQMLGVWFANPLDGGPAATADSSPAPRWKREGETFETLTLTPSIDASTSGHWHGHIRNGEIV